MSAVAWEHLSEAQRTGVLAHLTQIALGMRRDAELWRKMGETEHALHCDEEAMEFEAMIEKVNR